MEELCQNLLPESDIKGMSLVGPNQFVVVGQHKIKLSVTVCLFEVEEGEEDQPLEVEIENKYNFVSEQG